MRILSLYRKRVSKDAVKTYISCRAEPIAKKRVLMGQTLDNSWWEKGKERVMYKIVAYAL